MKTSYALRLKLEGFVYWLKHPVVFVLKEAVKVIPISEDLFNKIPSKVFDIANSSPSGYMPRRYTLKHIIKCLITRKETI